MTSCSCRLDAGTLTAGATACFTGYMLSRCMDTCKSIRSYPDIGERAFGGPGRLLVSVLLYLELFCCCVDFFILEGDNLVRR